MKLPKELRLKKPKIKAITPKFSIKDKSKKVTKSSYGSKKKKFKEAYKFGSVNFNEQTK